MDQGIDNDENLIIFIVPNIDIINGGVLSIFSIYEETKKLHHLHGCKVLMATTPIDQPTFRFTQFNNDVTVYAFELIPAFFSRLKKCIIHLPELYSKNFTEYIDLNYKEYFTNIPELHINILIQNIALAPSVQVINEMKKFTSNVTCTTAHERYTTLAFKESLDIPLHKLSTFKSQELFTCVDYRHKRDLMIVSPDPHPLKANILDTIKLKFPQLDIAVIQNVHFEYYKELVAMAKWAITFGEGLDGYFNDMIYSGGISFAVYNEQFFTPDFKSLQTVYSDYDQLTRQICVDIQRFDNPDDLTRYQKEQLSIVSKYYSYTEYVNNVERFYRGDYTFP